MRAAGLLVVLSVVWVVGLVVCWLFCFVSCGFVGLCMDGMVFEFVVAVVVDCLPCLF